MGGLGDNKTLPPLTPFKITRHPRLLGEIGDVFSSCSICKVQYLVVCSVSSNPFCRCHLDLNYRTIDLRAYFTSGVEENVKLPAAAPPVLESKLAPEPEITTPLLVPLIRACDESSAVILRLVGPVPFADS
jgi:hypothetical protein